MQEGLRCPHNVFSCGQKQARIGSGRSAALPSPLPASEFILAGMEADKSSHILAATEEHEMEELTPETSAAMGSADSPM